MINRQLLQEEIYLENSEIPITVAKSLAIYATRLYQSKYPTADSAWYTTVVTTAIRKAVATYDQKRGTMFEYIKRGIMYGLQSSMRREQLKPVEPLDYQMALFDAYEEDVGQELTDEQITELYITMTDGGIK